MIFTEAVNIVSDVLLLDFQPLLKKSAELNCMALGTNLKLLLIIYEFWQGKSFTD